MPRNSTTRGGIDDRVRLLLSGTEVLLAESYEVASSIFEQPTAFRLRMGYDGIAKKLVDLYPPGTEFELYVGDTRQHSGLLDGFEIQGDDGTTIDFVGRDWMRILQDSYADGEKTVQGATYRGLVEFALEQTGVDAVALSVTQTANRIATTGAAVPISISARNVDEVIVERGSRKILYQHVQTQLSERLFDFVKRYLDRAGLFLWAAAEPRSFVLGVPNTSQPPLYRIERGSSHSPARRVSFRQFAQPPRYARCLVYGRSGGKYAGRSRVMGRAEDPQMLAWGLNTELVVRDSNVADVAQATRHAYRKLAEGKKDQTGLSYEVDGHTTDSLYGGGRVVWAPDTMVHVIDKDIGIDGLYWVDRVLRRREDGSGESGGTTTLLELRSPDDLIFGDDE